MKKLLIDVNLDECAAAGTYGYMRGSVRCKKSSVRNKRGGVRNNAPETLLFLLEWLVTPEANLHLNALMLIFTKCDPSNIFSPFACMVDNPTNFARDKLVFLPVEAFCIDFDNSTFCLNKVVVLQFLLGLQERP